MNKNIKIILVVLLILIIGVFSFYYFNSKNQIDICCDVEPENGDDEVLENGEETEPENGNKEPVEKIELKDNYFFSITELGLEGEGTSVKLDKVNDKEYDYKIKLNMFMSDYDEFIENKYFLELIFQSFPDTYAPSLNKDFAEYTYNLILNNPNRSFQDFFANSNVSFSVPNDITFEEYFSILRDNFLKMIEMEPSDVPDESDLINFFINYHSVLKEMFNQDINFRNVTLIFNSIVEDEIFPEGVFKYKGDEKKVYFQWCNINKECYSLFGEDEWVDLYNYYDSLKEID